MAVDEALLDRYAREEGRDAPPTLRIYAWSPPAVSLGCKQPLPSSIDRAWLRARSIDLVRRPTGGRAVLHEGEWTYAVAGRIGSRSFPGGVLDTYARIAAALVAAFEVLGLGAEARTGGSDPGPLDPRGCFEVASAHEIVIGSRKVVGSAQARRRKGFVQHGSIPLLAHGGRPGGRSLVPGAPGEGALARAAGRVLDPSEIGEALLAGFARRFGAELVPGSLDEDEALRAAALRCWKYDSAAWTLEGKIGSRERRLAPEGLFSDPDRAG
jgi:lipoate-protein ligase A